MWGTAGLSEPKQKPKGPKPAEADDASGSHLGLADSSAGSTEAVDPDVSGSQSSQTDTGQGSHSPEVSTGGFETMLGKLVVDRGLATPEDIEECTSLLNETRAASDDQPVTLGDLLVDNSYVTTRQLERLRDEFETKKSTRSIPGYRIKEKLGAGAMATVFLAKQLSLDRSVAIKVLPKKFSSNEKFIERFYKEGRAAAQLNHPNIVAAYDVGKAGEHHYFVMEYVNGQSVYDRLVKTKRFKEADAISVVRQVALALQHAHEKGFIHRDIKPKNIMINQREVVKLADLGLARAVSDKEAAKAEAGRAYGTPYYISPEQIRGAMDIGPPADIYGLGATFYHMVTGRVPFEGKNPSAVMHKHLKTELKPPDHLNPSISSGTALVIEMMMAKDVKDRYQNATDLLQDLELIAEGEPPHFARAGLDLSDIKTGAQTPEGAAIREIEPAPSPMPGALFWLIAIGFAVSALVNIVLIAIFASG